MDVPAWVTSAPAAFAQQARWDTRLERLVMDETRAVLRTVEREPEPLVAWVYAQWDAAVERIRDRFVIDTPEGLLRPELGEFVPEAIVTTLEALEIDRRTFGWSNAQYRDERREALSLDTGTYEPTEALTAAIKGTSWRTMVKSVTKMSSTGLHGLATRGFLRVAQYPAKRWVTRRDDKVRRTHVEVDAKTVSRDHQFLVGGAALSFPGDPGGPPSEIYGCRCVIIGVR